MKSCGKTQLLTSWVLCEAQPLAFLTSFGIDGLTLTFCHRHRAIYKPTPDVSCQILKVNHLFLVTYLLLCGFGLFYFPFGDRSKKVLPCFPGRHNEFNVRIKSKCFQRFFLDTLAYATSGGRGALCIPEAKHAHCLGLQRHRSFCNVSTPPRHLRQKVSCRVNPG